MFEDIKQHVFCYQKVLKLVIQIFVNANNQPEINGNLYILNLGSSSMFSECHEICLLQHCFKTYTPFIQWTIKFKHLMEQLSC